MHKLQSVHSKSSNPVSIVCLGVSGLQKVACPAYGVCISRSLEVGGCPADRRKACWEWSR